MLERELYGAVRNFLVEQKLCCSEYVGSELFLRRGDQRLRVDVYGVSLSEAGKTIYLCEGKRELKHRSFGRVVGEAIELLKYGDYVYIFGSEKGFETKDKEDQLEKCEKLGIGVLAVEVHGQNYLVRELLKPKRNKLGEMDRKEVIFRVFTRGLKNPVANIIFQAAFECVTLGYSLGVDKPCVRFVDVYNLLLPDEEHREMVRRVIGGRHTLLDKDVRKAFQKSYGKSPYIRIKREDNILNDIICFTEKGMEKGKKPILLTQPTIGPSLNKKIVC
ncbi:MAG: hypothetical protein DRO11_04220 [Methanobacteriota archaeon]|nr:MAG: hypothetical protein DRO11_04220 [Euryarchaeota archaeon]